MSGKGKVDDATVQKRIAELYELLINGGTRKDALKIGREKWGVCSRQIDTYLQRAKEEIIDDAKENQREFHAITKTRLENLYRQAWQDKDLAECRQILATAAKVLGYEKLNLSISDDDDILKKTFDLLSKKNVKNNEED